MATHGDIGLSQPAASTITLKLDAISLDFNSTVALREVMVLGSPETTNAYAAVLAAAPASTAFGMVVRALPVSVFQSTAADLNVTVAGYSTTVNVSSLAGAVNCRSSAANFLASIYQSTAADLQVTASQNSTAWSVLARVTTSSGGGVEGSSISPAHNALGLHVREVLSSQQSTTLVVTSSNSTVLRSLISSVAGLQHKVHAYYLGVSTGVELSTIVFVSSGTGGDAGVAKNRWAVAMSSLVFGANLAVSQPCFLFRTDASEALNCRIESASTGVTARISLSWVTE